MSHYLIYRSFFLYEPVNALKRALYAGCIRVSDGGCYAGFCATAAPLIVCAFAEQTESSLVDNFL